MKRFFVRNGRVFVKTTRTRPLFAEQLENRRLMVFDLGAEDYFPDNRVLSDANDETSWILRMSPSDVAEVIEMATPAVIGEFTSQAFSFATLANGMPILNSLVGAPTSVFVDFDGDASTSTDAYDVDGSPSVFNDAEQKTIAEAWRHIATYFAMFDTNVTTILPATGHPKVWAAIGNNIVGGYCFVNTFPNNTQPRCFNNSGDARGRQSGIAHEVGHNFGLSHQSDFDLLGGETADYSSGYDELHVPIMGVDFAQRVRKFVIGHTSNASVLQDDVNIIRNKIVPYQAAGGDGFRADDFGGTIGTATALTVLNDVQYASGIIERLADVDIFSFNSNGQAITVSALADFPSGVDLKLEIYDALGVLVAAKDAPTLNDQVITLVLPTGTYYASVSSHGNYGDLGTYNLAVRSLPAGWSQGDIGVVGVTGFSQFHASTNSFVLGASGADIAGSTDEMQFARQTLTGDGTIIARVASLVNTTGNAKAGIEIRESLAANSKHVSVTPTPTGGVKFIRRTTIGGTSTTTSSAAAAFAPVWVRLQRVGNVFTASTSPNGVTWTTLGTPTTVAMNASVQIGLVATAQNDRLFTVAEFENVSITGNLGDTTPAPNAMPSPTGVSVARGLGSDLSISWADQASETGYRVERSIDGVVFTTAGTTAADVTTFVDTGLVGTMRYFYRVLALDASGASIPSNIVSELNRPSAVGNLELTSYSLTQVVLDWIETSGETGYRIERSADGIAYTTIATVGAQIPSYTDSALTSGTSYFYRVTPTSTLGDGPSTVISGGTRMAAVTNLIFSSVLGNAVSLAWTDLATETGYQIQRSTNGTTFTQLTTLPAGTITYTDATVTAGNEYYYRVLGTLGQSVSLFNLAFTATPTIAALPSPWISQDIGTVSGGGIGSTTYSGTTFKVVSSGSNIGGTSDSFRFTHQTLTGNGVITARVASLEDSGGTSTRFGVMFRETLNINARYAMMALREGNTGTAQFSSRAGVGTSAVVADDIVRNAPYWVRVTRVGNLFTGFTSSDGTTWTQIGQSTIAMGATLFVGLAASSGTTSVLNTATANNVSVLANPILAITSTNQVYNNAPYVATASITANNDPLPTLSFVFYSDAAGTNIVSTPVNVGTYYVRAFAAANSGNNAAQSAIVGFEITPFALTVSALGVGKVYDGNATANVTLSDNRFAGDVLTISALSTFDNKNIGLLKPITVTAISLSGTDAGNYTFNTSTSTTANIDAKLLTATGLASSKVYDGNTSAIVAILLGGIVGSESVIGSALGTFDSKNTGIGKIVSIGEVSLSGTDSANYTVGIPLSVTADVSHALINASVAVSDKVYDATTDAVVQVNLNEILANDVIAVTAQGTYSDKNVATNKPVTIGSVAVSGVDAGNYIVTVPEVATASITALEVTGSITAANRIFDETTAAIILTRSLEGIIPGDTVSYVGGTATFDTAAVGTGKTVTATGLTLSGADAGNYTVNSTATTTASITSAASVLNRRVFYNGGVDGATAFGASTNFSSTGGNPPVAAIDSKDALLPGQNSSFANYTNVTFGINGIIVDIANPSGTLTSADFLFAKGETSTQAGFVAFTPTELSTTILPVVTQYVGGGINGSTRAKITFNNNSLRNTWVRVTVLANANTGLAANDVFYFGNAVGDVNGSVSGGRYVINPTDTGLVRSNQLAFNAPVTNIYDFNKSGNVTPTDTGIVRSNQSGFGILRVITGAAARVVSSLQAPAILAKSSTVSNSETVPVFGSLGNTTILHTVVVPPAAGSTDAAVKELFAQSPASVPTESSQTVGSIDDFFALLGNAI